MSTDGVQEAQSGVTTDEAKEAADKLAAEQADKKAALDDHYHATAEADQRAFCARLLKRERAAVQSIAAFLDALPSSLHLDGHAESARVAAIAHAYALDVTLAEGEQMMGVLHG